MHPYTLYLSKEGDSIELKGVQLYHKVPRQDEATACKTQAQVLEFLENLKAAGAEKDYTFYHQNNGGYPGHLISLQGHAHKCSLDNQIAFVKLKLTGAPPRKDDTCVLL